MRDSGWVAGAVILIVISLYLAEKWIWVYTSSDDYTNGWREGYETANQALVALQQRHADLINELRDYRSTLMGTVIDLRMDEPAPAKALQDAANGLIEIVSRYEQEQNPIT